MRIYEELFILRPDVPEEEIDQLIEQLTTQISAGGGNVDKSEKWGIRKLAYRVQKKNEGFYVLLQFTAEPGIVRVGTKPKPKPPKTTTTTTTGTTTTTTTTPKKTAAPHGILP